MSITRSIIFLVIFTTVPFLGFGQKYLDQIQNQIKKTERYEGFEIPGYILRWGARFATWKSNDENAEIFYDLTKKIKGISIASTTLDQKKYNNKAIVKNLVERIEKFDHFSEYISLSEKDDNVRVMINEANNIIKNVVILSSAGRELSYIHIKSKLTFDDLRKMNFKSFQREIRRMKVATKKDEN